MKERMKRGQVRVKQRRLKGVNKERETQGETERQRYRERVLHRETETVRWRPKERQRERMKGKRKGSSGFEVTQIWLESLLLPAVQL